MNRALTAIISIAILALSITGCASKWIIDSEVHSFARWSPAPPAAGSTYRFERLPSQQSAEAAQAQLETMARTALDRVGLVFSPDNARFSVLIGASSQGPLRSPYDDGYGFGTPGVPGMYLGASRGGGSVGFAFPPMVYERPFYKREVTVIMRDLLTNALAYETRAVHEGLWTDPAAVLPAMFEAALRGFPVPPAGPRRIDIEIAR